MTLWIVRRTLQLTAAAVDVSRRGHCVRFVPWGLSWLGFPCGPAPHHWPDSRPDMACDIRLVLTEVPYGFSAVCYPLARRGRVPARRTHVGQPVHTV